jgi:hypothetical protein
VSTREDRDQDSVDRAFLTDDRLADLPVGGLEEPIDVFGRPGANQAGWK